MGKTKTKKNTKPKAKANIRAVPRDLSIDTPPRIPAKKIKQPTHKVFFHTKAGKFFEVRVYDKDEYKFMDGIVSNFDFKSGHVFESKEYGLSGSTKTKFILAAGSVEAIYIHEVQ